MKKLVLVLLLVVLLAGCETGITQVYYTAEYRAEGTVASANVTFGVSQYFNQPLPWTSIYVYAQSGDGFYLSAQSNDASGNLTVTALVDGIPVATQTTNDPFGFVAVYGVVP